MKTFLLALCLVSSAFANDLLDAQLEQVNQAMKIVEQLDQRHQGVFGIGNKDIRDIEVLGVDHPIGAMRFNLETRTIEIFNGAFTKGVEILASSLVHEIRHAEFPTHAACSLTGPFRGMEACDESLPQWENWQSGGSYVYELAFQKLAIEAKIPGHEKYIRSFIGNLHIRFAEKAPLEVIDQWLGAELLESEAAFIAQVRSHFY